MRAFFGSQSGQRVSSSGWMLLHNVTNMALCGTSTIPWTRTLLPSRSLVSAKGGFQSFSGDERSNSDTKISSNIILLGPMVFEGWEYGYCV